MGGHELAPGLPSLGLDVGLGSLEDVQTGAAAEAKDMANVQSEVAVGWGAVLGGCKVKGHQFIIATFIL